MILIYVLFFRKKQQKKKLTGITALNYVGFLGFDPLKGIIFDRGRKASTWDYVKRENAPCTGANYFGWLLILTVSALYFPSWWRTAFKSSF